MDLSFEYRVVCEGECMAEKPTLPAKLPPKKTYVREVQPIFTREEMRTLLKAAHAHCKDTVKFVLHRIGQTRKRTVFMRKRDEYLACIRDFIYSKIAERFGVPKEEVEKLLRGEIPGITPR
jgi:hypothetical protein